MPTKWQSWWIESGDASATHFIAYEISVFLNNMESIITNWWWKSQNCWNRSWITNTAGPEERHGRHGSTIGLMTPSRARGTWAAQLGLRIKQKSNRVSDTRSHTWTLIHNVTGVNERNWSSHHEWVQVPWTLLRRPTHIHKTVSGVIFWWRGYSESLHFNKTTRKRFIAIHPQWKGFCLHNSYCLSRMNSNSWTSSFV